MKYPIPINYSLQTLDYGVVIQGNSFQVTKPARRVPRVFVNRTQPGSTGFVGRVLGLGQSVKFDEPNDLILLGDCDQQSWKRELDSLQVKVMEP